MIYQKIKEDLQYHAKILVSAIEEEDLDDINRLIFQLKDTIIKNNLNVPFNISGKQNLQLKQ